MQSSFFGPQRSRQINLGGATTTASHAAILDKVKAQREERLDSRRRLDSAVKLQAWWRGTSEARRMRAHIRAQFDRGSVDAVQWTRWLVVGWGGRSDDWDRLGSWSSVMVESGEDTIFTPFCGPDAQSWLVLLRQVSRLLLQDIAQAPQTPRAIPHLAVLNSLLAPANFTRKLAQDPATQTCSSMAAYILTRGFYSGLASAMRSIPTDSRASASLPPIVTLLASPFLIFPPSSPLYNFALDELIHHILSLPLLPNRLPLASLTYFSSRIPLSSIFTYRSPGSAAGGNNFAHLVNSITSLDARIHLLANLLAFIPVRIPKFNAAEVDGYLSLCTTILDSLPIGSLENNTVNALPIWQQIQEDVDSDAETSGVPHTSRPAKAAALDGKTQSRLQTLHQHAYINTLLTATSRHSTTRPRLFSYMISLWTVWPSRKERILNSLVAGNAGFGLIKEVWRGWIRRSSLGKEEDPGKAIEILTYPAVQSSWPPLLFLTEAYNHMLLTMGDDEFFSSSSSSTSNPHSAPRPTNPMTLDELASFSHQLMNITFPLYWHEDLIDMKEGNVPGMRFRWEAVRDRLTRCLQALHMRDSRRPFVPEDNWLVSSQIDLRSFVEAVVYEEQQLDRPNRATRVLSKRQMAFISPRLGVLNNIPFAIPFQVRVEIFRHFVRNDMESLGLTDWYARPKHKAVVRRGFVAQDGFDHLGELGPEMKGKVQITFIDQWGNEELGIDGGGVFKEFLTSLSKEAFDTDRGLWLATAQQELYPNPHSYAKEPHQLNWYRFLGRVLGKALYEGILVEVAFASFFLGKWLKKQSYLDDLQSLDPELYQGLVFLKHYAGDPEDLSLNFTVTDNEFGVAKTIDLIPNGSNIAVTRENRTQYILLVANYRLNTQIKPQSEAFFEGLSDIIDPKWLRMFNQKELRILIGGIEEPVDVDDLQKCAVYGGLYDENHDTIKMFWKVVKSFDQGQRQSLLRFVTSCSRPPLLGFKELNPNFAIRDAGEDQNRLPTASTCVNLLKLPRYQNENVLRAKLLQAISSNAGFDLS